MSFKIGDEVVILQEYLPYFDEGDVCQILDISRDYRVVKLLRISSPPHENCYWSYRPTAIVHKEIYNTPLFNALSEKK
jgi:hypothetical protein